MSKLQFAARFQAGKIDEKAGIIYGVSLATVGPARGHGVMCDHTTLEQLRDCARQYSGGLKVKMTHRGDAGDIVGAIRNIQIEGSKLLGDLHLLDSYEKRAYVLEIAAKIPDTFGLSVAFSGPEEVKGAQSFARCAEIYSCDLVSEPAANPDGLFSVREIDAGAGATLPHSTSPLSNSMTSDEIKALVNASVDTKLTEFSGRVRAVEDSLKTFSASADVAALKTQVTELSAKLDSAKKEFADGLANDAKRVELAAQTVAKEFSSRIGNGHVPADGAGNRGGNGGGGEPTEADKFDASLTKHFAASGKSTTRAWQLAMAEDPKGHAAFIKTGRKPAFEKASA